jgi:hypothetical protein
MTRFVMGLLLGLLAGIAGTAAFLITAQGGDYLIVSSPRVRELEATLKHAEQDREWMRKRLQDSNELLEKLRGRFETLASRFEELGQRAAQAPPSSVSAPAPERDGRSAPATPPDASDPVPAPTDAGTGSP